MKKEYKKRVIFSRPLSLFSSRADDDDAMACASCAEGKRKRKAERERVCCVRKRERERNESNRSTLFYSLISTD